MKQSLSLTALVSLLLLSEGCTAHYCKALREYRRNEPTPFYRRTLEWTKAADEATSAPLEAAPQASLAIAEGRVSGGDPFLRIAGEFFGVDPGKLEQRLKPFRDSAQLDHSLADRLEAQELSLAAAVRNPEIQAARDRWQATLRQYEQAEFLESLVGEYRTFTRYLDVQAGEPINRQMTQSFSPSPSVTALKGDLVREQARLAELDWQRALRETVVEAGLTFYDYQYLRRAEEATRENAALVKSLLAVIEERYRAGAASQPDLLRAQTELARQENMLVDLEARRRAAVARINALLNRSPDAALGPPSDDDPPEDKAAFSALLETALARRQEIRAKQAEIARMEIAIRLGEAMDRPLASQGYSRFERGMEPEASGGASQEPFGLEAKSPDRPAYAQAESYLAEMRQRLNAERREMEQLVAQTRGEVRSMIEELDVARREADLIARIVLPQNRSAYESILSSYTAGRSSFIDLLDAERELIGSRLDLYEARRELSQTLVRLARIVGRITGQ